MMEQQKVVISQDLRQSLSQAIAECKYDHLFILVDETTARCCLPVLESILSPLNTPPSLITIGATDQHKTLDSLSHVWSELQRMGATRHSLMINLGGGMVTDLGDGYQLRRTKKRDWCLQQCQLRDTGYHLLTHP